MPLTSLLKSLCAKKLSSAGTVMLLTFSQSGRVTSPTAKIENAAGSSVWHRASAAAIFIGCCWNMSLPCTSPLIARTANATTPTQVPSLSELRQTPFSSDFFHRCQAPMPTRNVAATANAPAIVCGKAARVVLLVSTAQIEVRRGRPLSSTMPTGCCIHELAARMKYALAMVARLNAQAQARWTFFGSLSQPKIHRPRNVDSTKKATSPSIASGAPNTSPTNRE